MINFASGFETPGTSVGDHISSDRLVELRMMMNNNIVRNWLNLTDDVSLESKEFALNG